VKRDWRFELHEIVYESNTKAGKAFDITLIISILLSITAVILDSIGYIKVNYDYPLKAAEWFFTILFTLEYLVRIISVKKPWRYMYSFFGVVDLLSILPTYLSLVFVGLEVFLVIRVLRLLRLFRVFKMTRYVFEGNALIKALKDSKAKIIVFLMTVFTVVIITAALMHIVEGPDSDFSSIPKGIYWAIVTMTTVGFGDVVPKTVLGQILASILMILGYGIIAVPTGIVTAELAKASKMNHNSCPGCGKENHEANAKYCKFCGEKL